VVVRVRGKEGGYEVPRGYRRVRTIGTYDVINIEFYVRE
jgi:hypothetical protein